MPRAVRYSLMCLPSSTSFPSLIQGCHDGCHFTIKRLWRRGSFAEIALSKVFDKKVNRGYEGMGLRVKGGEEMLGRRGGRWAGLRGSREGWEVRDGRAGIMPHSHALATMEGEAGEG